MAASTEFSLAFSSTVGALAGVGIDGAGRFALAESASSSPGLTTTSDFRLGDELLRIPLHLCLTGRVEDAPEHMRPALELVAPSDVKTPEALHRRLCTRLWLERLKPSTETFGAWLPGLESAARARMQVSALIWSKETLARCGPLSAVTRYVDTAQEEIKALLSVFEDLSKHLPDVCSKVPDASEAEWLHITCQAYTLPAKDRLSGGGAADGPPLKCLVPLFDVAQTTCTVSHGAIAELVTGTVIVSTLSALQAGCQVACVRGSCPNDELAVTSGMVSVDNPHQQVVLSLAFGTLRKEQLTVLQTLGLDQFLRGDEKERAVVSIVLRKSDPFPNVAVVLARVLTGSEGDADIQKVVSTDTADMDRRWVPTLLNALKSQLQQYPMREGAQSSTDAADVIYDSSREVLKTAVAKLLGMTKLITSIE